MSESKVIILAIEGNKVGGATLKGDTGWAEILQECGEAIKKEKQFYNVAFRQEEADEILAALPIIAGSGKTWSEPYEQEKQNEGRKW